MWSVRILSGPQAGEVFDLKKGKNIFGRGANCDVKIQSVGISKEHCEIHVYKNKVMIVDLKSSNGTFVNGIKIQQSLIKLGYKLSLFDIIMDIIPTPDIRPKNNPPALRPNQIVAKAPVVSTAYQGSLALQISAQEVSNPIYPQMQMQSEQTTENLLQSNQASLQNKEPELSLKQKIDHYIENVVMESIYKMAALFPFSQLLLGFVLIFVFAVTLLSLVPLTTITQESNYLEASKRARTVARTLAIMNETALSQDQFSQLNVAEALKEDGITEALIISQLDGSIVAPTEIAGREVARPMISQIRKEQKALVIKVDSKTIGASQPIGTYDLNTGETKIKYHAIVFYDVGSLNVDEGRVISLFMQTLIIASLLGMILYFIFFRVIQYPLLTLNKQIDSALKDKLDRAEVFFDFPVFQQTVANVNLLLSRVSQIQSNDQVVGSDQQNKNLEYNHIVNMINQPALVISVDGICIAMNNGFELISQMSKDSFEGQHYSAMTDVALMQNIESLISKAKDSPLEKHMDRIPFSQFECDIVLQTCLSGQAKPEYFFIVMNKIE
jgi:Inner membrane component of T3SS, cytoplasmic domain